jgi:hypothetical protein
VADVPAARALTISIGMNFAWVDAVQPSAVIARKALEAIIAKKAANEEGSLNASSSTPAQTSATCAWCAKLRIQLS